MTEEERKDLIAIMMEAAAALAAAPGTPPPIQAPDLALRLVKAARALYDAQMQENLKAASVGPS
jgi:hypothetical protein